MTFLTAASLRAILCFIDPENTPKIAYDRDDEYVELLIEKVKKAVGDKDGSQTATIMFTDDEQELERQFMGVCKNIENIFKEI